MSFSIVKLGTYYPSYLENYYFRYPGMGSHSYTEQLDHLMADGFATADFYQRAFADIGVVCHHIVANVESLQSAWAADHGIENVSNSVVIHQLNYYLPDVLFIQDAYTYNNDFIDEVRAKVPSIKLIVGWCGAIVTDAILRRFSKFDFMLSCMPQYPALFESYGVRGYHLNHAFEAPLLPQLADGNPFPIEDLVFTGSLNFVFNRYQ